MGITTFELWWEPHDQHGVVVQVGEGKGFSSFSILLTIPMLENIRWQMWRVLISSQENLITINICKVAAQPVTAEWRLSLKTHWIEIFLLQPPLCINILGPLGYFLCWRVASAGELGGWGWICSWMWSMNSITTPFQRLPAWVCSDT